MSNALFPALPGLTWTVVKRRISSTIVAQNSGGKEVRVAMWQDPIYEFEMNYELLRENPAELAQLIGFINARQGSFDSFLYLDPTDSAATAQACIPATGDGTNKLFQIARQVGASGYSETIQNVNGSPAVYLNGVLQSSGYTVGATGIIAFTAAPSSGVAVTWTGNFYFRCRFSDDQHDFTNFSNGLWSSQSPVKFRSVKL